MSHLSSDHARDLCLRLIRSETEQEVVDILGHEGYWSDREVWRPYGDIANNCGIVGNQQSSPVAALVEKLVNSIDAVLTLECFRAGIDPSGPSAPRTMQSAAEMFLAMPGGRVQNLDAVTRTGLAERIQLVACGTKDQSCYFIIDDGEGQDPEDFPGTFLSLFSKNKSRIHFVQGKYNMGGTGVLQFAGTHSFQLIVSRRQPEIPSAVRGRPRSGLWGFTLVRRLDPGPDQPHITYVYLAPGGLIASFHAEYLPVRPGRYPDPYEGGLAAGTCVKLWNYKLPGLRSLATIDLRYALERHLQDPAVPVRMYERRPGFRAHSYDTTMSGLFSVIADNPEDIEPGMDTGSPLAVPGVGSVQIRIVVVRDDLSDARKDRYRAGVFYNVNGQLHFEQRKDFLSRRTKLEYIADSMMVMADCTSLPRSIGDYLFLGSRDRIRQCAESAALEEAIVTYLKDHPGLRNLNARRREARLASATSEEETAKVIQDLVRSDPTFANLFGRGQGIRVPLGPLPEVEPYVGRKFPTYFRISREPKEGLVKTCPRNRTCRVEFETDASNDYFSRATDPGHQQTYGAPTLSSVHLWNGKATLRFAPPTNCSVGDRLNVTLTVTDVSRLMPLESRFTLEVDPDAHPSHLVARHALQVRP